jgi:nucleoside-diphosphate-sugar epimerase
VRIIVIGATGNVGTSLVEQLAADERVFTIVAVSRRPTTWSSPKVTAVGADVAADDLAPHLEGADAVVHLAWLFQPTHRPSVTWRANVVGSERVFAAAASGGVPALVYASSVGAYSPAPEARVSESWPTHSLPTAAYGREKAYVERLLDIFEARHPDVRVVRLRPGFIFKRPAATEQRRLFAGPFVPRRLTQPGRLPVLPVPEGLRFQAVHADDVADAYVRATVDGAARGAFNIAAEPVIDAEVLGQLLGSRVVRVPRLLARSGLAAAWRAHLTPADPALLDLALELPLLDTTRAAQELGWTPRRSGTDALREMIEGVVAGAGGATPPLAPDSPSRRLREAATGVGERP